MQRRAPIQVECMIDINVLGIRIRIRIWWDTWSGHTPLQSIYYKNLHTRPLFSFFLSFKSRETKKSFGLFRSVPCEAYTILGTFYAIYMQHILQYSTIVWKEYNYIKVIWLLYSIIQYSYLHIGVPYILESLPKNQLEWLKCELVGF